ncbi:glycosyltransferase [Winogradskyella aurantiaca]|uniref:glycosyltransferase n=1 Tax=Winogradskyella aurantiaca TaxID=2219558 RepID=UPI0013005905|nr:glycosyltransferase [Winogradskyella aurantiaca]
MRILFVSIKSVHFKRWISQLEDCGFELYFFDINGSDGSYLDLPWLHQRDSWKLKLKLPGYYRLKKLFPWAFEVVNKLISRRTDEVFEGYLNEVKPDVVHSFALQLSCTPIISIMQKYPNIYWIYSSWGSDLYYHQSFPKLKTNIQRVLGRVNYAFSDCNRDVALMKNLGFEGSHLGVFPGGGGYKLDMVETLIETNLNDRNCIIVKGYEGEIGRCINVLKALELISHELKNYRIIIFSADEEVINVIEQKQLKWVFDILLIKSSKPISQIEVMRLMGKSLLYIGNSISDGMPNTLLEAVIMGAFPIQSNPGGVSEEIITPGQNGLVINDPENIEEIKVLIQKVITDKALQQQAFEFNQTTIKPQLDYELVKTRVFNAYKSISIST